MYVGTSFDQLYAQRFGQDTPIPSMQLCIENINQAGGCAYGYTLCVHGLAELGVSDGAAPGHPRPAGGVRTALRRGRDPRTERRERRLANKSVLDVITGRVSRRFERSARARGSEAGIERYLENVREIERRIEMVEARNASGDPREIPEAPAGVPDSFTRAHAPDVRPAGAGLRVGHDPGVQLQAVPRLVGPGLPGERIRRALPPGVAPRERSRRTSSSSRRSTGTTSACSPTCSTA